MVKKILIVLAMMTAIAGLQARADRDMAQSGKVQLGRAYQDTIPPDSSEVDSFYYDIEFDSTAVDTSSDEPPMM
ncbi:MAG: hypothetical protein KDI38_07965 [Calditrichaeota bacterium]|nr:hypothetical protein [Calditrichota bacterium]MCB0303698.1 hypothetical protein [Calditrichota bacterium]